MNSKKSPQTTVDIFVRISTPYVIFEKKLQFFSIATKLNQIISLPHKCKMNFECSAICIDRFTTFTKRCKVQNFAPKLFASFSGRQSHRGVVGNRLKFRKKFGKYILAVVDLLLINNS